MDWNNFKQKFHPTWHTSIKPFIISKECNNIYAFLKSRKGNEIAPKSTLTFRSFEQSLKDLKVVVLTKEPYSNKNGDMHYADGIPLSCDYVEKMHPQLDNFYNALEEELYGLQLNMQKHLSLDYLTKQGVMFLSDSLTVEIDAPGSHQKVWDKFTRYVIFKVLVPRNIPIIFCGTELFEKYYHLLPPMYPFSVTKEPVEDSSLSKKWCSERAFTNFNNYLWEKTNLDSISWLDLDLPF